uniref:16S rRNA (Guanine(966)-N(2))-methyltransferase RsmD n=1 Tax=candidate division WOR-3 bacterium TaxID=2052148 RepID=A0A7C4UBY9_UNCW3
MRIISGILGGRKIKYPPNIRPTSEKVREAIFSMMDVKDKLFLDLFAGSGAVGIEAYSRGAKEVWFVEKNERIHLILKENIKSLGVNGKAIRGNVFNVIKNLKKDFDIIFLDPPYDENLVQKTLLSLKGRINSDTIIIIESSKRELFEINNFEKIKEKKYGETIITILKGAKNENSSISRDI